MPPVAEREQVLFECERRTSIIAAAEKQIERGLLRSTRLRQSILKRAFEGKLVPQDPQDEPTPVLLERIKAEREASARNGQVSNKPRRARKADR